MLRVRLLGEIRIDDDGTPRAKGAPVPALALLAYLLLHPGPLRREGVAFALWPDVAEAEALAKLRRFLFALNSILPRAQHPWILADRRTMEWNAALESWVDALEFERLARESPSMDGAIELYGGPLLLSIEDDWARERRASLERLYVETLTTLVAQTRRDGDARRGLQYARRLLDVDPLAEEVVREVMYLRAASGDRSGALRTYRDFAALAASELGAVPMAETRALRDRLAAPARDAEDEPKTNLPYPSTSFVGRSADVQGLVALVRGDARLTTITGLGGIGKSRVAIEVGRAVASDFADGVWLAELTQIDEARLVAGEIARIFGVTGNAPEAVRAGLAGLLRRKHLLLILDNCEHVLASVAGFVEELLRTCDRVRVLATSRERLHLIAESIYALAPLRLPEQRVAGAAEAMSYGAVELFVRRAEAIGAGRFTITDDNAEEVAAIVRRTDGIPLAVELAVPWLRVLGVTQLHERLRDRFRMLTRHDGSATSRQLTLDALIRWSVESLLESQRAVLTSAAVFPGSFTLQAIAFVQGGPADEFDVIAAMGALVDKSLLTALGGDEPRFALLDTVREFAGREQPGETLRAQRDRHAAFCLRLARQADDVRRTGTSEIAWVHMLQHDRHNLYAALEWSLAGEGDPVVGAELAVGLRRYFDYEPVAQERFWLRLALERTSEADAVLRADAMLAFEVVLRAEPFAQRPQRLASFEEAAAVFRAHGESLKLHVALGWLAWALKVAGRRHEATAAASEGTALARSVGSPRDVAWALRVEMLVMDADAHAERRSRLEEALALLSEFQPDRNTAATIAQIADINAAAGNWDDALRHARDALRIYESQPAMPRSSRVSTALSVAAFTLIGDDLAAGRNATGHALDAAAAAGLTRHIETAIVLSAYAHALAGGLARAAMLLGYVAARNELDDLAPADQEAYDRLTALLRSHYEESELDGFAAIGAAWSENRAIAEAHATAGTVPPETLSR